MFSFQRNLKSARLVVLLCLTVLILLGCQSVPVRIAAPNPPGGYAGGKSELEKGRAIYVSMLKCAMCHRPKPVYEYDVAQWTEEILPKMATKARLNPEQYRAVHAYVTSEYGQTRPTVQK